MFEIETSNADRIISVRMIGGFRRVAEREPLRQDMRFFTAVADARDWLGETAG